MNATFLQRFKAFMIDYLVIALYLVLIFILSMFLFPPLQQLFTGSLIVAQISGFFLATLPVSLYFIISDSVIGKQSLGKRKIGIQVVDIHLKALSIKQMTFRTILKFLPWEMSHFLVYWLVNIGESEIPLHLYLLGGLIYVLIFTNILSAIFTKKKQSLYDIMTNSFVITKKEGKIT
ncbi:RDD family protein [Sutcliffiella rhizosphaerae]|uniref:RDD domain-containing protein n=1 Tax=Sutcliffiella rhizosphaerae TaxID=2880967 RepID=A0ABM8YTJ1_9BACI|nr:RDD family protein [Sutcliffiella rhizosphaerae]CAG9623193.1 hypothetical protein BACCIP111883_03989 [Sutcliffiella rhizosphaerae]